MGLGCHPIREPQTPGAPPRADAPACARRQRDGPCTCWPATNSPPGSPRPGRAPPGTGRPLPPAAQERPRASSRPAGPHPPGQSWSLPTGNSPQEPASDQQRLLPAGEEPAPGALARTRWRPWPCLTPARPTRDNPGHQGTQRGGFPGDRRAGSACLVDDEADLGAVRGHGLDRGQGLGPHSVHSGVLGQQPLQGGTAQGHA